MSQRIASLYAEIGADTTGLKRGLDEAKARLQQTATVGAKATQQMADDFTRLGADFRKLPNQVDDWIGRLKASTPQNLAFAQQVEGITTAFQKGELSAKDAAVALQDVRYQMNAARPVGERMADGFKSVGMAVAGVTAAAAAAVYALKQVLELGERGAAVRQTAESFGLLMDKVGVSTGLLERLREASKGTVDDMTLMSSTATLLAGAHGELAKRLAGATPELLEIAKAANKLNPTLGDTTYMYQSLALGIKRASPMILDNLGLTVKIGEANQKMADSLGKSVEQLTAEEQKMALLNATLEAGKILIDQVGGSTDSATDSFSRLDTAWSNAWNSMLGDTSGPIAILAEKLATFAEISDRVRVATEEQNAGWTNAIPTIDGLNTAYIVLTEAADYYREGAEAEIGVQRDVTAATKELTGAQEEAATATENVTSAYAGWTTETYKAYRGLTDTASAADTLAEAQDGLAGAIAGMERSAQSFLEGTANDLKTNLDQYLPQSSERWGEALGALDDVYGTTFLADAEKQSRIDELNKKFAATGDLESYKAGLKAIRDEGLEEIEAGAEEAILKFQNLKEEILGIPTSISVDIYINEHRNVSTEFINPGNSGIGGGSSLGQGRGGVQEDWATGVSNFVVPPGYPNDSFMVGLSSGEVVDVTPAGQGRGGSGSGAAVVIEEVHIHNEADYEAIYYRLREDVRNGAFV
jgi:hypothetical protein